ncbi:hypothetical protein ACFYWP_38850 [Actinacidiphila glaucinigra]|uniref:hypothetical protein n=1 Tax=Actinacidiphila glaucinigra TaxID=235986 RepID=UPI0036819667
MLQAHGNDLADRFTVQPHGGQPIPWTRFCYGPGTEAYSALYRRLHRGESVTHPVAVTGTVQRVNEDRQGRPYVALALNVPAGKNVFFHVAVRSAHPSLMEPLTVGTSLLAIGEWQIFYGSTLPQLRLWADEHWQLAYWTTGDDEQQTTPRCPPPVATRPNRPAAGGRDHAARPAAPRDRAGASAGGVRTPANGDASAKGGNGAPPDDMLRALPAFPPADVREGSRRSALGRWLRQVRGA